MHRPLATCLRRLRHHAPAAIPVSVRLVTQRFLRKQYDDMGVGDVWAGVTFHTGRAVIHLDRAASATIQNDSLTHEWAHILDDPDAVLPQRHEHRNSWGECFARAYRASITPITSRRKKCRARKQ